MRDNEISTKDIKRDDEISTRGIELETGVSRHKLANLARRGLLPRPRSVSGPGGRGRQLLWPIGVIGTIYRIDELMAEGVGPAEIARRLRSQDGCEERDLEAERRAEETLDRWRMPGSAGLAEDSRTSVVNIVELTISNHLERTLGVPRDRCDRLAARATADALVRTALFNWFRGIVSVLRFSVSQERVDCEPDFLLTDASDDLVVRLESIFADVRRQCPDAGLDPFASRISAAPLVDEWNWEPEHQVFRYEFARGQNLKGETRPVFAYERLAPLRDVKNPGLYGLEVDPTQLGNRSTPKTEWSKTTSRSKVKRRSKPKTRKKGARKAPPKRRRR